MKKYFGLAAMLFIACFVASCSDDDESVPASKNRIYLTVEGNNTLSEDSDDEITVKIELSRNASENLTLDFTIENDTENGMVITNNPLIIAKGNNSGVLVIKSKKQNVYEQLTQMSLAINGLDTQKYMLDGTAIFFVKPSAGTSSLTPEQQALIDTYKQTYGIDLTPWMDAVALQGSIEFPGDGYRDPFVAPATISLNGKTVFTLSENSDADQIVLKMTDNPMGMAEYMHTTLRQLTVEDAEYFANEDAGASYELMQLLNWNSASAETFSVTLDNLKLTNFDATTQTADIEFVTEGTRYVLDKNGEQIYDEALEDYLLYNYGSAESWIPFEYNYSAWDRMLDLISEKNPAVIEIMTSCLASPASYLGVSDILTDYWGIDEEEDEAINLYVTPKGRIDFANGTMTFEFPFDHADQYGYSRVNVTYSLQK